MNPRTQSGMTLLELVIALTILATVMIFTTTSIQQAITSKAKIQSQLDDMSRVRDALKVIERDVNLAFHHRDLETEYREKLKKKVQSGPQQPQVPLNPFAPPPPPPNPNNPQSRFDFRDGDEAERRRNRIDPTTHFIGSDDEMYFPTLNSARVAESSRQSDAIKVGYFIESCSRPGKKGDSISTRCLFRKSSPVVEPDFTKGGEPIALIEYVEEFKLRYKGPGKQDWVSEWKSTGGDGNTKNKFPSLVEVSLTTNRGTQTQPKKVEMQMVIPLRFPNNEESNQQRRGGGAVPPPPGGG